VVNYQSPTTLPIFDTFIQSITVNIITNKHRQIIVITGSQSDCLSTAKQLTHKLQHRLLLDDQKKARQYLGQEFDAVTFNAHKTFDANAFGAITGTIRGGGYLLLLKTKNWAKDSLFLTRFDKILSEFKDTQFISAEPTDQPPLQLAPLPQNKTTSTNDQNKAVDAIINVVKGHRRRPLVINADRGRGKSAALGIAASQLYQQDCKKIIVCAPSKKMADVIFEFAKNSTLEFYSPDELQQQKPKADLVLIDEAASIPISMLTTFVKNYSRIVFATTQHGYEGSGRGFTLNFKKTLDSIAPNWKSCHLSSPIRWQENDRLEQFVFQTLLLNAEAANPQLIQTAKIDNCQFQKIKKQNLVQDESLIKEIFGLLVDAHYQTKPSDFLQMLDDKSISIYILSHNNHVIAVSLLVKEGGLDQDLATEVFAGKRRIKGHLVAQSLAANVGLETAPCLSGQRIMRIAVHPLLQKQGLGSLLIEKLLSTVETNYFSTCFGATKTLLGFWKKNDFTPVYLSMKRDASSGTHSVIMLNTQQPNSLKMLSKARQSFVLSFPFLLAEPFKNLESNIALDLFKSDESIIISGQEQRIINAFSQQQRGYENSYYPIWKLVLKKLSPEKLNQKEKEVILLKILQKHNWKMCAEKIEEVNGKNDVLQLLRRSLSNINTAN